MLSPRLWAALPVASIRFPEKTKSEQDARAPRQGNASLGASCLDWERGRPARSLPGSQSPQVAKASKSSILAKSWPAGCWYVLLHSAAGISHPQAEADVGGAAGEQVVARQVFVVAVAGDPDDQLEIVGSEEGEAAGSFVDRRAFRRRRPGQWPSAIRRTRRSGPSRQSAASPLRCRRAFSPVDPPVAAGAGAAGGAAGSVTPQVAKAPRSATSRFGSWRLDAVGAPQSPVKRSADPQLGLRAGGEEPEIAEGARRRRAP